MITLLCKSGDAVLLEGRVPNKLIDMLTAFFVYIIPQRLNNGYGIVTKTASNTNVITKDGKLGEEFYKAGFEISMFMEHQFFLPYKCGGLYQFLLFELIASGRDNSFRQ